MYLDCQIALTLLFSCHYNRQKVKEDEVKLDKSTKFLINLVLILLIALFLKLLINGPTEIYAQTSNRYKVTSLEEEVETVAKEVGSGFLDSREWEKMSPSEKWTYLFNWNAGRGWHFHSFMEFEEGLFLIFSR
jgi:hypothetical protein